jgi:hypothetical protein
MNRKIVGVTVGTTLNPERIAEKLGNNTKLPSVTEKDEGKVLMVQGGKWTAQEDEDCRPLSNLEIEKLLNNFT